MEVFPGHDIVVVARCGPPTAGVERSLLSLADKLGLLGRRPIEGLLGLDPGLPHVHLSSRPLLPVYPTCSAYAPEAVENTGRGAFSPCAVSSNVSLQAGFH